MAVTIDPIHQFELKPLVSLDHIGHQQLAFTQSALYMFAAVGVIALITIPVAGHMVARASWRGGQVRHDLLDVDELTGSPVLREDRGAP